jgi:hypothetical protein
MVECFMTSVRDSAGPITHTPDVAEAIWRAATDPSGPLRIPAGGEAKASMAKAS